MTQFEAWASWQVRELEREAARREGREEPPPFMWPALPPPYAGIFPAKGAPGGEWRVIGWRVQAARPSWTRAQVAAMLGEGPGLR